MLDPESAGPRGPVLTGTPRGQTHAGMGRDEVLAVARAVLVPPQPGTAQGVFG